MKIWLSSWNSSEHFLRLLYYTIIVERDATELIKPTETDVKEGRTRKKLILYNSSHAHFRQVKIEEEGKCQQTIGFTETESYKRCPVYSTVIPVDSARQLHLFFFFYGVCSWNTFKAPKFCQYHEQAQLVVTHDNDTRRKSMTLADCVVPIQGVTHPNNTEERSPHRLTCHLKKCSLVFLVLAEWLLCPSHFSQWTVTCSGKLCVGIPILTPSC